MEIKPIQAQTKVELFIAQVESWIFSGQLKPGESLPSERELANKMNISRSVVNSGLNYLANLKLITIIPQKGSIVNDYFKDGDLQTLNELLSYAKGNYDLSLLKAMYAARKLVEGEIIQIVSSNLIKSQAALLHNLVDDFTSSDQQLGELLYLFFHQLAIDSGNIVYPLLISSFNQVYVVLGNWNSQQGKEKITCLNHQLVDQIAAHQTKKALKLHNELVEWSLKDLLR